MRYAVIVISCIVLLAFVPVHTASADLVTELWSETYDSGQDHIHTYSNNTGTYIDNAHGVAIDSQNRVIVAGQLAAQPGEQHSAVVIRYDPATPADPIDWSDTMEIGSVVTDGTKDDSSDAFYDVTVDQDDNMIVGGVRSGSWTTQGYHQEMYLRKYTPGGVQSWEWAYDDFAWNGVRGVTVDTDNNIYSTGSTYTSWGVANQWVTSLFDPLGVQQPGFPIRYDSGINDGWDIPYSIAVDSDDNMVAAGFTSTTSNARQFYVRKFDAAGVLAWDAEYGGVENDYAYSVDVDTNGDVYVGGFVSDGDADWLVVKLDAADGSEAWAYTFESAEGRSEVCNAVAVDFEGHVLAAGYERDAADLTHRRLVRLDSATGDPMDEYVWDAANNESINGLAARGRLVAMCGYTDYGTPEAPARDILTTFAVFPPDSPVITTNDGTDFTVDTTPLTITGTCGGYVDDMALNDTSLGHMLGETAWETQVELSIGANVLSFVAVDEWGVESAPATITVTYEPAGPYPFGDVNRSGSVDAVDVQLVINMALGLNVDYNCDLDDNGSVNAVDVQLVINTVLGV